MGILIMRILLFAALGVPYSRGCAHGRAAQVEAWPPPPDPADADDARPLGLPETHSKTGKTSPRAAESVAGARVLMMLAGWPPGSSTAAPETRHSLGNGCETRSRSERPPGEGPHGPMEKRGSDEAGRRH